MTKKITESVNVKKLAIEAILDKKGNEVVSLDLTKIKDTVSEYLIIAHGDSSTHVRSLCDYVEDEIAKQGVRPYRVEGAKNGEWIIIDYVDVTVHIFYRDKRDFYALEDLWSDAKLTKHSDVEPKAPKVTRVTKKVKEIQ